MYTTEDVLLEKWDQQHKSIDSTDQDRQSWFSDAATYLQANDQANDHWWCQHEKLLTHFAELFVYHTQPVVQRLSARMSQQLSECAACVVRYHSAQVNRMLTCIFVTTKHHYNSSIAPCMLELNTTAFLVTKLWVQYSGWANDRCNTSN